MSVCLHAADTSAGDYDMDKMAKLVPSLPRPTFSSPAQRLLLPVRGSSPTPGPSPLPLCFDLGSTDPVRLLDDSSTGRLQVDYTLRQTGGRSAELNILGHSVPASRVSAPDYRDSSKPTVDCWLFPHKSVLQ
ncbi:hypothetical protein JZ751_010818 [Albula glossodonta]|uniref:Uncharacterized protein n=1 Tax=Albula glossodonta TaxID=121402 RepID=A0A8T2N7C3_9TELE|nr:hypothetical protein JZ751_010818 [Albula glossodonta]